MVFNIVFSILIGGLIGANVYMFRKLRRMTDRMAHLALKVKDNHDFVDRVDKSTGKALNDLRREMDEFKDLYGEATAEEIRESAKAQKAWADGLNSIVQFGASHYGGGNSE